MLRLIVLALAVIVGLMAFRVVPLLAGVGLMVVVLVVATAVDQRGRSGPRRTPAGLDPNKGQLHGQQRTWQTPQPYIDHRDGGGVPAGVETQSRVGGLPAGSILDGHADERR